jgi:hypothetical protein
MMLVKLLERISCAMLSCCSSAATLPKVADDATGLAARNFKNSRRALMVLSVAWLLDMAILKVIKMIWQG